VLAESGVLDGCEATTTWWLAPVFRQRYPHLRLDAHRIVVPVAPW
jgi:transcriptional regulator GlxA family with amidase domain